MKEPSGLIPTNPMAYMSCRIWGNKMSKKPKLGVCLVGAGGMAGPNNRCAAASGAGAVLRSAVADRCDLSNNHDETLDPCLPRSYRDDRNERTPRDSRNHRLGFIFADVTGRSRLQQDMHLSESE